MLSYERQKRRQSEYSEPAVGVSFGRWIDRGHTSAAITMRKAHFTLVSCVKWQKRQKAPKLRSSTRECVGPCMGAKLAFKNASTLNGRPSPMRELGSMARVSAKNVGKKLSVLPGNHAP